MKSAKEYRAAARASLSNRWGGAVIMTLVFVVIMCVASRLNFVNKDLHLGTIAVLMLLPMSYSFIVAFLDNIRENEEYKVGQIFVGFNDYTRILGTLLLRGVYVFLWMLLLIVPGIIKQYSYAMTEYILRDYPELRYNAAIERSMAMMRGHKFDLFYLHLTFIGWALLCCITLGIGFLWLYPYVYSAQAHFYEERKAEFEGQTAMQAVEVPA